MSSFCAGISSTSSGTVFFCVVALLVTCQRAFAFFYVVAVGEVMINAGTMPSYCRSRQ